MFQRLLLTVLIAVIPLPACRGQNTQPVQLQSAASVAAASQPAAEPAGQDGEEPDKGEAKEKGKEKKVGDKSAAEGVVENAAITHHELTTTAGAIKYTATAAHLLMKDEEGKLKARVFFVAYDQERGADADPATRPITFVFNGGPGAAAVWLHLGTAGPRRVALTPDGDAPPPPYQLVDNAYSWLGVTDLVFIDPVGTGFSRPEKGERGDQFYGVRQDIASVGDFIRLYMTRYQRWASPVFLAGESYGTTRAAGLAEYLPQQEGIALNGVILISTVLDFATLAPGRSNDTPFALYLPTYTALAWYHRKLAPDLQANLETTVRQAEQWAMNDYLVALGRGNTLTPEARQAVVARLATFTSLPPELIERANLRIDPALFQKQLLAKEGQVLGRFDGSIIGADAEPISPRVDYDPSLTHYLPLYTSTFNDYVRRVLKFESTLPYEALSDRVRPWKFTEGGGYLNMAETLRTAMIHQPHMKIMIAGGYFDLATPYLTAVYTVEHMNLTPNLRTNLTLHRYEGGHMMYHHPAALKQLSADIAGFIQGAAPITHPAS